MRAAREHIPRAVGLRPGARSAGFLVVRLLIFRLLVVELLVDLGIAQKVVRVSLDLLGLYNLLEPLPDVVVIRRGLKIAGFDQLNDVPAVLSLNRLMGVLAWLQRGHRVR